MLFIVPTVALADPEEATGSENYVDANGNEVLVDEILSIESNIIEIPTANSADDGIIEDEEGNYQLWIDRVNLPLYAESFYNVLANAVDGDGVDDFLIEDKYFTGQNGSYGSNNDGKVCRVSYQDLDSAGNRYYTNAIQVSYQTGFASEAQRDRICNYAIDAMHAAYNAFIRDYPEVFWLGRNYSSVRLNLQSRTTGQYGFVILFPLKDTSDDLDLRTSTMQSETAIKAEMAQREANIEKILQGAPADATPYEYVAYFNSWLTEHNEYNTRTNLNASDVPWDMRECVNALAGKTGINGPVCEAYAKAFNVLCNRVGVPCVLVDGYAKSNPNMSSQDHMWNYAQIDDQWYAVDVTWNDPASSTQSGAKSGNETDKWLLLGENTLVRDKDFTFIASHPVSNTVTIGGLSFDHGPTLSPTAYETLTYRTAVDTSKTAEIDLEAERAPKRKSEKMSYTYVVLDTNLPGGLSLDRNTGRVTGTITNPLTDPRYVTILLLEDGVEAARTALVFESNSDSGESHVSSHEWNYNDEEHWQDCFVRTCDEKFLEGNHEWDKGVLTVIPTYEDKGERVYTCTVCGYTVTEEVATRGHHFASTWSSDAENHWYACADQGYDDLKDAEGPHKLGDWITTSAPTHTRVGTRTATCTICGYKKTETLDPLGHTSTPTYSYDDDYHWLACSNSACDGSTARFDHEWTVTVEKKATATTAGTEKWTCSTCKYSKTETVPATGSSASNGSTTQTATFAIGSQNPLRVSLTNQTNTIDKVTVDGKALGTSGFGLSTDNNGKRVLAVTAEALKALNLGNGSHEIQVTYKDGASPESISFNVTGATTNNGNSGTSGTTGSNNSGSANDGGTNNGSGNSTGANNGSSSSGNGTTNGNSTGGSGSSSGSGGSASGGSNNSSSTGAGSTGGSGSSNSTDGKGSGSTNSPTSGGKGGSTTNITTNNTYSNTSTGKVVSTGDNVRVAVPLLGVALACTALAVVLVRRRSHK